MKLNFNIKINSGVPKYQQLVNAINNELSNNLLSEGDALPSVNKMCGLYKLSRDTVFKAYTILKNQGVIKSVPSKGYYIANETRKVLLVLDTFKAYKEVLYHSFINNLPDNIITDVQFHHYNIDNFKTILNNSKGKYYKYVVMTFDNDEVSSVISNIDNDKLLLIDWNIHSNKNNNYVFQDFGKAFFDALKDAVQVFRKYEKLVFLYPTFTFHPKESILNFKKYVELFNFEHEIITEPKLFKVEKNVAYISTSDRMLGKFLEQCKTQNFEPGVDVGFLSYNETPMKKFIYKGISVISTDFEELGTKAAEFVTQNKPVQHYVPTKLIVRESL
ncbi:GntR family transcriptional regulator [Polaribacter glomeratus]|uniref:GntR family transcriptional regulator n=1 Tax=Polaribacter glomeratus TaxID=102 RepID=A0A2S7WG48_9FLAO|nr:GntR family transcriptional regulator [Polaribacter glomeratus]PQJ76583.1 GntR family transcriptional regulator [Polaribacter glomeratus]TXD67582.1 GntR family transcriptional regulator [Polaribacter glomeratus]